MLQRSGLMSVSAIREAYLARVAQVGFVKAPSDERRGTERERGRGRGRQTDPLPSPRARTTHPSHGALAQPPPLQDLQQQSAAAGVPPPRAALLAGELAKLTEDLGADLDADWAAAEAGITTTGRAARAGGATKLMPRPAHRPVRATGGRADVAIATSQPLQGAPGRRLAASNKTFKHFQPTHPRLSAPHRLPVHNRAPMTTTMTTTCGGPRGRGRPAPATTTTAAMITAAAPAPSSRRPRRRRPSTSATSGCSMRSQRPSACPA